VRHLILSCSDLKNKSEGLMRAMDLYQGVAYKVLKNYKGPQPKIWIISAKYGFISGDANIQHYDLKMTPAIAAEQRFENTALMLKRLIPQHPEEVGIFLGSIYLQSIDLSPISNAGIQLTFFKGPIGKMLQQLKNWLNVVPAATEADVLA
jgi:hypothetical protein